MRTHSEVETLFRELFPIESPLHSLVLVPNSYRTSGTDLVVFEEDTMYVVVQMVTWDVEPESGNRQIRDIKEQELFLSSTLFHASRLQPFLAGWRSAIIHVFESQEKLAESDMDAYDSFKGKIDTLMPHDLFTFDALELKTPNTPEDFADALLQSKKRLARFVAPSSRAG